MRPVNVDKGVVGIDQSWLKKELNNMNIIMVLIMGMYAIITTLPIV